MPSGYLIRNARIINEDVQSASNVLVVGDTISWIGTGNPPETIDLKGIETIDADGCWLIPGAIDDQVHFREPGLTHKGRLYSESRAAVAGGITSFMEMPNTKPGAVTHALLEEKYALAAEHSIANYSFYLGATNNNLHEVMRTDPSKVCGIKVFMGSSTGDLLVDDRTALNELFRECKMLIALHCEDDQLIAQNVLEAKRQFGAQIPINWHPRIRSAEACLNSSSYAVALAHKHNTRIHILHISTAEELKLFTNQIPLNQKRITAEACVHHLWFSDADYASKGSLIKWNPAIKTAADREAIRQAVVDGRIDVLATDHAPHTLEEKANTYFDCPSGAPLVQEALPALFELARKGVMSPELIVRRYCHAPAELFGIERRGFIREGYFADLVLLRPDKAYTVKREQLLYKCGWSPLEGETFHTRVEKTFVNGNLVYNQGKINEQTRGSRLSFKR
ncbi:MAG: dihydroorotase [Bacteroidia bacterium]|nr:dihydroorotase [Bacteroidia bacterium]MCC6768739.1 dihydroorotase [Bacteroidia bacterium]